MTPDSEKPLDEAQLADTLIDLPGWELKGKQIVKTYVFKTFPAAIEFVGKVAELAEKANHHPDIHIMYTKVKILSSTHKFNAVTRKDTRLAGQVDALFESL